MYNLINCADIDDVPVGTDLVIVGRYNRTGNMEDKQAFIGVLTKQPNNIDGDLSTVYMQYCGPDQLIECVEVNKNPSGYYCLPLHDAIVYSNSLPINDDCEWESINEDACIDSGEPVSYGYVYQD